jgi:RHS repeat-associated protein
MVILIVLGLPAIAAAEVSSIQSFEFGATTDFMHARYYSPNLGRFMSVDPVGGTVGSSQSWNRYSYVRNNPITMVDPNGEVTLVFTLSPGSHIDEKFGHSAAFIASPSGDHGGISYGGVHSFDQGVAEFVRAYNAEGRSVAISVIDTTTEQEAQMTEFLRSNLDGGTDRDAFGATLMLRENCAQAVGNVLEAGGVFPQDSNPSQVLGGMLSNPGTLLESVEALDDYLGTFVLKPDDSQERENFLQFFLDFGGSNASQQ